MNDYCKEARKKAFLEAAEIVEALPKFNGWGEERLPEPPHYEFYINNEEIGRLLRAKAEEKDV